MARGRTVLIVDDDRSVLRVLSFQLGELGYAVHTAASGEEALELEARHAPGVVLTDLAMPGMDGMTLLARLAARGSRAAVVLVTAHGSLPNAVAAIKAGAFDFVSKPVSGDELAVTVARAFQMKELERENRALREIVGAGRRFEDVVAASAAMVSLVAEARRAAATDATILVTGESGTGKEVLARAIHLAGARAAGPFVPINCAAIPSELVESELFGHRKGAFTGAVAESLGRIREAEGGTLFLDEVGELPAAFQPKLLRFLQDGEVVPVGGGGTLHPDVRVIGATNQDLEALVASGRFRQDLFYRVNVVELRIPPLRERREDIPFLAGRLLQRISRRHGRPLAQLRDDARDALSIYAWPGNVRELENALERAAIVADGAIGAEHLPARIVGRTEVARGFSLALAPGGAELEEIEREAIRLALEAASGNQSEAARLLRITRSTLLYRMRKHGLDGRAASGD